MAQPNLEKVLLDTAYIQALLNVRDQHHTAAIHILPFVRACRRVWVTEPILLEVTAALSASNRPMAAAFVRSCYATPNIHVVSADTPLFLRGLELYESRHDKTWSLTDCLSFIVMWDEEIHYAATSDHHFEQAGFTKLM